MAVAVAPHMTRPGGRIVNISSIAAFTGGSRAGSMAYAAAKAGVLGLTYGLARELSPQGITVNAIVPGFIANTTFADWTTFFDSESYPEQVPGEDDYLAGNTRIVLWKVLERLIQEQVFSQLNMAPLFRLGHQLYEKELVVLRILNWPILVNEK